MDQFDSDMQKALEDASASQSGDPASAERVIAGVSDVLCRRRRRGRMLFAGAGIGAAAVLVAALNLTGATGSAGSPAAQGPPVPGGRRLPALPDQNPHTPMLQEGFPFFGKEGEPCLNAEKVPLTELPGQVQVPVWMPKSADASLENLAGAWKCGTEAALTFDSGVTVSYESGWSEVTDMRARWATLAEERGGGEVGEVLGQPALIGSPGAVYPPGEVFVVVDGDTLMWVEGDGKIPATELVDVANSIDVENPLPPK
jgi:hypothetical protein